MRLRGELSNITCGAQGIGLAAARKFAAEGAIGAVAEAFDVDVTRGEQIDTKVEQGSGVILNAYSVVDIYSDYGQSNYAASEFGAIGFAGGLPV